MSDTVTVQQDMATMVVPLLQGPVYEAKEPELFADIVAGEHTLRAALHAVMRVDVVVDHTQRFAYIRSHVDGEPGERSVVRRQPLSFRMTVLLVVLRQELVAANAAGNDKCELSTADIVERVAAIRQDVPPNRLQGDVVADLNKLKTWKLVQLTGDGVVVVLPVLSGVVTAEWTAAVHDHLGDVTAVLQNEEGDPDES